MKKITKGFKVFALVILLVAIIWTLTIKLGSEQMNNYVGYGSSAVIFLAIIGWVLSGIKKKKWATYKST